MADRHGGDEVIATAARWLATGWRVHRKQPQPEAWFLVLVPLVTWVIIGSEERPSGRSVVITVILILVGALWFVTVRVVYYALVGDRGDDSGGLPLLLVLFCGIGAAGLSALMTGLLL